MTSTPVPVWQFEMDTVIAAFEDSHPFGQGKVVLQPSGLELSVLVAESIEQKARGMIGRDWGEFDGMVFVEPVETTAQFHMAGVTVPIMLALFDGAGRFLERFAMSPGDPEVTPQRPFRYALELPWEARGMLDLDGVTLHLDV